jgi:hypothetical protein
MDPRNMLDLRRLIPIDYRYGTESHDDWGRHRFVCWIGSGPDSRHIMSVFVCDAHVEIYWWATRTCLNGSCKRVYFADRTPSQVLSEVVVWVGDIAQSTASYEYGIDGHPSDPLV